METKLTLAGQLPGYLNDVWEVARAFAPFLTLVPEGGVPLAIEVRESETRFDVTFTLGGSVLAQDGRDKSGDSELKDKKYNKRLAKTILYRALSAYTGVELPYGSLTGVRPTRLLYELYEEGKGAEALCTLFHVRPDRARLIADVVETQRGVYRPSSDAVDIFVNIPFCPTRCSYCSFISTEIGRVKKQIPRYVDCVVRELHAINARIADTGKTLRSIYVGGGTPTSLSAGDLERLLAPLTQYRGVEFSVECGRVDSFDAQKLDVLAAAGVNRICINPQTFSDRTLAAIGRTHTAEDVLQAYRLARRYPFAINMDLIAGLPGEDEEVFADSVSTALSLRPENLTLHTLSLKRGAEYRNSGAQKQADGRVCAMMDRARAQVEGAGYRPYYMYRQKNMADNLENVGYTLPGHVCRYNVDYMEETNTVLAAGAGAVTKYVDPATHHIRREANGKGLNDYLAAFGD